MSGDLFGPAAPGTAPQHFDPAPSSTRRRRGRRRFGRTLMRGVTGALLVAGLVGGGTLFRVWQVGELDQRGHVDFALVLGAAQYNGTPSPALRARLEHAKNLYDTGTTTHVVTVGGKRTGDHYSEGGAGRKWLIRHGVPANRVIAIGEGSDTLGSIRAAAAGVRSRGWDSTVIVSDPWHSQRARTMAGDQGLSAHVSPTHHSPSAEAGESAGEYVRDAAALVFYKVTHAPVEVTASSLS